MRIRLERHHFEAKLEGGAGDLADIGAKIEEGTASGYPRRDIVEHPFRDATIAPSLV